MIIKNLAMGIVVTPPSTPTAGTTATLRSGEGAYFSTTFPFLATTAPPDQLSNPAYAEIILVTGITGDQLTFVRTKRGTSAQPIAAGWIIANGIYVEDVNGIAVTVATAAATATKVGTTGDADYVPALGDHLLLTFSSGMNVNSATINIDGSGAKPVRIGNVAITTSLFSTTTAVTVPAWYDGTAYQLYGSYLNTTYAEIADTQTIATTGTTTGLITGRRLEYYKQNGLMIDEDSFASNTDQKMPTQQSVKAYVDAKSAASWVFNETPGGTINGTNTVFTLAQAGSNYIVALNGSVLKPGSGNDYTVSGTTLTMLYAPETGSNLIVTYTTSNSQMINGSNSLIADQAVSGTINGTNKVFTTSAAYIGSSLKVFVNGLKQQTAVHFVETTPSSGTFTLDEAPIVGDIITVEYQTVASVSGNADTVDGYHAASATPGTIPVRDSLGAVPYAYTGDNARVVANNAENTYTSASPVTRLTATMTNAPAGDYVISYRAALRPSGGGNYSIDTTSTSTGTFSATTTGVHGSDADYNTGKYAFRNGIAMLKNHPGGSFDVVIKAASESGAVTFVMGQSGDARWGTFITIARAGA